MHGTLFLDKVVPPLEAALLPPEGRLERAVRDEHDVVLFQVVGLHPTLAVPDANGETVRVVFDLVLPLHEGDDGCDDEGGLAAGLGEEERDGLDPACRFASGAGSEADSRLAHAHLVGQHAALPDALLLLSHPVQALLLERQERQLERRVRLHHLGLDGRDGSGEVAPDVVEFRVMLHVSASVVEGSP